MPSRACGLLAQKFGDVLRRELTYGELMLIEELVLNRFANTILKFVDRFTKKPLNHTFDGLYAVCSGGVIRAADRGTRKVILAGKLLETYTKIDSFKPDMNDGELMAVIALADKYTLAEIDRGIAIARSRKVTSVQYVLGVCLANINKPTERAKTAIKPFIDDVERPDAKTVADAWEIAAARAQEKLRTNAAERAANDATEDR